jgi:hypothetical protein
MRLCFGSYLAVLVSCKAPNVENKALCEALLHSVAPNFEFTFNGQENADRIREDVSSKLLRCDQNLSKDVIEPARSADPQAVAVYFKDKILRLLDGNRRKHIILALKDIIANDPPVQVGKKMMGIDDDTQIDFVGRTTKKALAMQKDFCFSAFLAGVFLFVVTGTTNRSGKDSVKSVTDAYILSFADRVGEINLIEERDANIAAQIAAASQGKYDIEFAEDVAGIVAERINTLAVMSKSEKDTLATLLTESRGKCLSCGKELGVPVRGKLPSANCEVVYVKFSDSEPETIGNAVALCERTCAKEVAIMSDDEKTALLEAKRRCADIQAFLVKIEGIKFQREIEAVLREIHRSKNDGTLERTNPKDLVEIEQKIHEPYLKDKIDASMVRLYKKVKQICGRLEQEIGFDTKVFGEMMKSAQIILTSGLANKPHITDPQEYVTKLVVEKLFAQVGQRHEDACEIIIGFLVKRCDLFNETAKQS